MVDAAAMSFDDAIRAEQRNRELQQQQRDTDTESSRSAAVSAQAVLDEFLTLMAKAGNPSLRVFKQTRGKHGSLLELLPARLFRGWAVRGVVITPEGRIFGKLVGSDEL